MNNNRDNQKENEDLFRLLVQGAKDYAIFTLNDKGIIASWNNGASRMNGYDDADISGRHFSVFYTQEDIEKNRPVQELEHAKEFGSYEEEGWRVKKDGTLFWASDTTTALYNSDGTLKGFAKVTRDITAQKKIQEENKLLNEQLNKKIKALKKSKAGLTAIIEHAEGMFWSIDTTGRLQAFNSNFTESYKRLRLKTPKAGDLIYDDYKDDEQVINFYKQALAGEKVVYERAINVHGETHYVRVSFNPVFINNKVTGLSCFALDLTEKVLAQQKLKASAEQLEKTVVELQKVFNYSVDLICTIDAEGRFMNLSKASEAILGYKPEELVGRKWIELVVKEDVGKSGKFQDKVLSGEPVTAFENNWYRKNGAIVPVALSVFWSVEEKTLFCVARDATEQKQLEKAYNREKDRFTNMFLKAPVCIRVLKGKNYVYEMVNPEYLKTFGKSDVIGKSIKQVFPEVEAQGIFELLDKVYETGESFSGKEMMVKVDREGNGKLTTLYVNFVYQAYRNSEDEIEGIFFFGQDVTEQVEARKKTEDSEKRYSSLIQDLPAAIYTADAEGRILLYNKAAAALWGQEPECGKDVWCSDCKTYKPDGTLFHFEKNPLELTLKENKPIYGEELIIESAKGLRSHVLPYTTPTFDSYNNLTGTVNMLIDITDRKKAEEKLKISNERFELVIKATNDAIWDYNLETESLYWNESYERLFGYSGLSEEQSLEDWIEKIYPEDRERVRKDLLQRIKNKDKSYWQIEYRYYKANNEIANVCNRGMLMFNEQNKPVRLVGVMEDITERKKIEIEKEHLIEHLTNSNRDLQQFNYITSHNLRAPLSNLIALLNMLDYDSLNNNNKELLGMFKSSTRQLDQTINDLNQILIIKDNVNLEKAHINITGLFKSVCKYFWVELENLVTIDTDFACETVAFNKSYLESILSNLISNALKYASPQRQLKILITTQKKADGKVLLVFSDNGIGIDMQRNKDRIFGLYQRFHSNTTGKGLGLFITKSQITSLGGKIEVESEPGKGTTFYITFTEM